MYQYHVYINAALVMGTNNRGEAWRVYNKTAEEYKNKAYVALVKAASKEIIRDNVPDEEDEEDE